MSCGKQVDLGPGDIVLDGEPAPFPKGARHSRQFCFMSVVANRLDG